MNAITPVSAEPPPLFSIEAEQSVLGALLMTNGDGVEKIRGAGGAGLFYDPVHARIFESIALKVRAGDLVSPVTLKAAMIGDAGLADLGGPAYLMRLTATFFSAAALPGYIDLLAEMAHKRQIAAAIRDAEAALARSDRADSISMRLEGALMACERQGAESKPVSMMSAVVSAMNSAVQAYQGEAQPGVVHTGLRRLDQILPGMYPGDLILIGGRPSMGKSALALVIAMNVARSGQHVAVASLEMTPEAMAIRAISEATSAAGNAVPYTALRRGALTEDQMRSAAEEARHVGALPLTFLPRGFSDVDALVSVTRQIARTSAVPLRLLVVDYAQLLRAEGKGRYEQITAVSMALKKLAMTLGIPVIALSQLSREIEKRPADQRRPTLSDLRESGQLEQDADAVMFCYREEYYLERAQPGPTEPLEKMMEWEARMERHRNRMEVIVAKQRQGELGTAYLGCALATNRIWSE